MACSLKSLVIKASASANDVIATSYAYLEQAGISQDAEVKIAYTESSTGKQYDMTILVSYLKDSTGTNEFLVVYVDLADPASADTPTDPDSVNDDNDDSVASSASVVAAALAGLALLLLIVMSIVYCVKSRNAQPSLLGPNDIKSSNMEL